MESYNITSYYESMSDKAKVESYRRSLEGIVGGKVVLDLNSGLGLLPLIAIEKGAKKVFAVENSIAIQLARRVVSNLKLQNRIMFFQSNPNQIDLPEKVDIIVSSALGSLGIEENIVTSLIDARNKFLKKDGIIIPNRLRVFLGLFHDERYHSEMNFWKNVYGYDYTSIIEIASQKKRSHNISADCILAAPQVLCDVDLYTVRQSTFSRFFTFVVKRSGILNSFCGWFEAILSANQSFGTFPNLKAMSTKQAILPLAKSYNVNAGDEIFVWFDASPSATRFDDLSIQFRLALKRKVS